MVEDDIDPKTNDGEDFGDASDDDSSEDEMPEEQPSKEMYTASNATEWLGKSWLTFGLFFGLYYIVHFGMALCCCNFYAENT